MCITFEGNLLDFVRARAHVGVLTTRKSCAVGMRNAILRNCLKCEVILGFVSGRRGEGLTFAGEGNMTRVVGLLLF